MRHRALLLLLWLACQLAAVVASLWMLAAIVAGSPRAWRIALGYDHLGNAVTGGDQRESISSRANRARSLGLPWGCLLCRLLDRIERDHCASSAGS